MAEEANRPLTAEQIARLAQRPSEDEGVEMKAHYLLRKVSKTVRDYDMIAEGDHIAVAVSGGKDSLSLLDLLVRHLAKAKEKYRLSVIHVETTPSCGGCLNAEELDVLCRAYGLPFLVEQVSEEELRGGKRDEITCFGCSFQRRKALFIAADRIGCNRVAFAHHRDDAVATALMNLFRHGTLLGLEPVREMFGGALTLIRPLYHIDERRIADFNRARGIPKQQSGCPNAYTSERARMARLVREIQKDCPAAKANLLKVVEHASESESPQRTKPLAPRL